MSETFYLAEATVQKVAGVHRRATLPVGSAVDFGVHGTIKDYYKLSAADDLPLPVDHIVAATGA